MEEPEPFKGSAYDQAEITFSFVNDIDLTPFKKFEQLGYEVITNIYDTEDITCIDMAITQKLSWDEKIIEIEKFLTEHTHFLRENRVWFSAELSLPCDCSPSLETQQIIAHGTPQFRFRRDFNLPRNILKLAVECGIDIRIVSICY